MLRLFRIVSICLFSLLLVPGVWGQKDAGTIAGTIRDASGAAVPQAKITVTEVDKGTSLIYSTGSSGDYVASPLPIGRYSVKVEKDGFKTAVTEAIEVQVQQRAVVDITLQVGAIAEHITVTNVAPLLETETSELGQVIDNRRVVNLPLNGRNFAQLAQLSAGVAPSEPGARNSGSYGFSSNGGRSYQNNILLDGIDNNSNLTDLLNNTSYVIQPSVDALQEFKVQTNAYSAEFGRGNGAILNASIKSGTNQFHGDLYEFLRNDKLDGRNFFDSVRPAYQQNQFGATLGGPVIIPHLYNGRNRTFFFVDYEGLRVRQGETLTATVPSIAERGGDFSELLDLSSPTGVLDCNGVATYTGEIFNSRLAQTQGGGAICGVPFGYDGSGNPVNVMPSSTIDPLAARLAGLFPSPDADGSQGFNFVANPKLKQNRNNFDVRVDQNFSDKDAGFFRFSFEHQPSIIPAVFQATGGNGADFSTGDEDQSYRSVALSETHLFTTKLINEFRFGYNRVHSRRFQFNFNKDVSAELGIPGVPFTPINGGMPEFDFGDVDSIGDPTYLPSLEIQNTYSYSDNLTRILDKHTIRLGAEIRSEEFTIFQPASPRGNLFFDGPLTDNPAATGTGGSGFAQFLLGLPSGGNITNLHNVDYGRPVYAFYLQDDYKVTPKLTLNLGLRYELFIPVRERFDQQGTFDLATRTMLVPKGQTAQFTPLIAASIPISDTAPRGLVKTDKNNFAPRIGFAYKVTDRAVLRGGYGVFYGGYETGPWSNPSPGFNPPFFVTESFNQPCGASSSNPNAGQTDCSIPGLANLANGFPASSLTDPNTPQLLQLDPKIANPYMQQWNLSTQYELPGQSVLQVTYAGSKGTRLYTFYDANQAGPSSDASAPFGARRPVQECDSSGNCNPVFDTSISNFASSGSSIYHSLQTRFEKRLSGGLSFLASYTWSHSIDNASSANLGSSNNSGPRFFRAFPQWERGNSDFDVRHRFVLSYIYDLPIGQGKRFAGGLSGAADKVLGGWQIAGITTLSTGNWYTITDGNGNFSNSDGGQRADLVPGQDPNGHPCVPGTFFNTCAFQDPPSNAPASDFFGFGNAGRNIVRGPGLQQWDFSIFKIIQTSENTHFEFRTEIFNLPNHANFLVPSGSSKRLGGGSYGFATAAAAPRQIQFGLKFYF